MNDVQTGGSSLLVSLCYLAVVILLVVAMWRVFVKAGQPGWAAIIPIYNLYIICKIAGKPGWWVLLMLIPLVGFIIALLVDLDLAKAFGKGAGFAIGLWLLPVIFYPILAFGDAQYGGAAPAMAAPA
jgi:hypothetical protein